VLASLEVFFHFQLLARQIVLLNVILYLWFWLVITINGRYRSLKLSGLLRVELGQRLFMEFSQVASVVLLHLLRRKNIAIVAVIKLR
jgi:hypothetical protein